MKKIIITISIMALAVMLVLMLGGCTQNLASKLVEKAIENAAAQEGENVDVNLDEGQVNVTDAEGNEISIGGTTKPEGWPDVIPVNENITIQFSSTNKTDNKMNYSIIGTYDGTAEDLYNYYKSELASFTSEYDSVTDSGDSGKLYSLMLSNDVYSFVAYITEANDEVGVTLGVTEK